MTDTNTTRRDLLRTTASTAAVPLLPGGRVTDVAAQPAASALASRDVGLPWEYVAGDGVDVHTKASLTERFRDHGLMDAVTDMAGMHYAPADRSDDDTPPDVACVVVQTDGSRAGKRQIDDVVREEATDNSSFFGDWDLDVTRHTDQHGTHWTHRYATVDFHQVEVDSRQWLEDTLVLLYVGPFETLSTAVRTTSAIQRQLAQRHRALTRQTASTHR